MTARLPTAIATTLLPAKFTVAAPVLFRPLACMLLPVTEAETAAMLYWTLVMDALAVFRPAVKALTWIALLAELP